MRLNKRPRPRSLAKAGLGLAVAATLGISLAVSAPGGARSEETPIWLDTSYSFAERAAALVAEMTVPEKILQLDDKPPAIARLGLAAYDYWNEALHGVVASGTTMFPSPTAIGSTFNRDLVATLGNIIGNEARALNNSTGKGLTYWSPTLNISRDPRWGRADESYGEDPYLVGEIGEQFITGLQGDDETYLKAISTPKHYFANNSESNRRNGDSVMTEREIREYYTPAFAQAMSEEVGAYSFMTAYNRVNGVPMSLSSEYLETMARRQWGFDGYVTTDCSAIQDSFNRHLWTPEGWDHSVTPAEAVAWALKAGSDIDCQGNSYEQNLQASFDAGLISEADLDAELTMLLEGRFRLGEFDPPAQVPYTKAAYTNIATPSYQAASLAVSNEAPVLLKNENIPGETAKGLPLTSADAANIAVVGYLGDVFVSGGYSGSDPVDGRAFTTALTEVAAQINPAANVNYVGPGVTPSVTSGTIDICEIIFQPGYDVNDTGGFTCPMYWSTTTASGKPGIQNVTFKNSGTAVGDPIRTLATPNGYPLSITDDPAPEQFIIWEGWMGINWGYPDYMQPSSVWGGYFAVRHDFSGAENEVCLAQSGDSAAAAKGGVFQVHLDSMTGPIVATVPAEGDNSGCDDDGLTPGTVNGTVSLTGVPTGIHDLYFVYDNGALGAYGQAGTPGHPYAYDLDSAAEATVAAADAVIVVIGTTNAEASEEMDRVNIDLPRFQDELVNKIAALNDHTVVWMQSVGTMDIEAFKDNPSVPSIVWTNYNGQHQSIAAANILFGQTNPSGRLPMTWYSDLDQLGSVWDYGITPATTAAGYGRTYQYFTGDVSYPFGYGLSYSSFSYSNLALDKSSYGGDDTIVATVDVTNNGAAAGKEVVQLYVSAPGADGQDRPLKQLRGFEKVSIASGATATVTIKVAAADLWMWDEAGDKEAWDLGQWTVQVGPDSAQGLEATFDLTSAPTLLLDIVKTVPDGVVLNTAAPGNVIHANLSATRTDETFYDLGSAGVAVPGYAAYAADGVTVTYSVANAAVASVDANGIVRAVGEGVTTVTATVTAGTLTKSDSFPVVVQGDEAGPVIELPDQTIEVSDAGAIAALAEVKLLPAGATATLSYLIAPMDENSADATIDPVTGEVTATQLGRVRITAKAEIQPETGDTYWITRSAWIDVVEDGSSPPAPPTYEPSEGPSTEPSTGPSAGPSGAPDGPTVTLGSAKVAAGQKLLVTGTGFEPGETVAVIFDGAEVGSVQANDQGAVSFEFTVPAATAPGRYAITLTGAVSASVDAFFEVTAAGTLPVTGSNTGAWVASALLILGVGVAIVLAVRPRRKESV
ncbi:MAG: glycoside hydrolase family 3 C-terminal domain-containing protein [Bifidobacteriaceae bacterium]|jgi:beta-glucosidase-like glycosyl hydrolase|nr:glycoside hydrolase family 3 C-terminal domain-containing protein [Bifidobacteriaceae bacterium]